jgi:GT2 family glycosyltransferase
MQAGDQYVFLLNNDAVIAKNTLSLLRKTAEEHPDTCLGPKIYYYDQPTTIWYGGGEWDPKTAFSFHVERFVKEQDSNQQIKPTQFICGCALFAPVSLIEKIGLMEPRFFLNWEEIDWCFRMRRVGFECLYIPAAKVWHKGSSSFVGGKRGPMWNYFYFRNRLLWMERHLQLSERLRIARKILWPECKYLLRNAFDAEKGPACRAVLAGFRDYFLRRFGKGPSRYSKK